MIYLYLCPPAAPAAPLPVATEVPAFAPLRVRKGLARERFLRSPEWREAREVCFAAKGRLCHECGSSKRIQVDHILPRSKFPHLALEQTNLQPLCWPCNKRKAARVN